MALLCQSRPWQPLYCSSSEITACVLSRTSVLLSPVLPERCLSVGCIVSYQHGPPIQVGERSKTAEEAVFPYKRALNIFCPLLEFSEASCNLSGACDVQESGAGCFCVDLSAAFIGVMLQHHPPWKLLSSLGQLLHLLPPSVTVSTCFAAQYMQLEVSRLFCTSAYMPAI